MFAQAPAYLTLLNCHTDTSLIPLPKSQCLGFGSGFSALQKLLKMSVSDCTFLTALVVTSMGHIEFGCKNAFLTQFEVPYYKCHFKIVAKTSDGLGMSKRFELDCSTYIDH